MRKSWTKVFLIFIFLFLIPSSLGGGIGIRWYTESEIVEEGKTYCINYGLYNPFEGDVYGYLKATGDLENISQAEPPKLIPEYTSSSQAIPTRICFTIPRVYNLSCIFPNFLCERKCDKQVVLEGEVLASYYIKEEEVGMGSRTGASFAAPLRLYVKCEEMKRDYTPLIIIFLGICGIAIFLRRKKLRKKRRKKIRKRKKKLIKKKKKKK